jgi:WXG100 family type VII secretion target
MGMRTGPQGDTGSPGLLQTNLDTMVSASQFVHDAGDTIHQQLTSLRTQLDTLRGSWNSAASRVYDQKMIDWDARTAAVRDALYAIGDGLTNSHQTYNQMEEDNVLGVTQASQAMG